MSVALAVTTVLDDLGIAACVFGPRGLELHRSSRMRELLSEEPDADALLLTMRALACDLFDQRCEPSAIPVARAVREVAGVRAARRLRGVLLPSGSVCPDPVVVVELERSDPSLPLLGDLVSRCGLTPREAEVALLLAKGGSDREIARQLALSPHTVRKHVEHIFDKLRLHSRKALLLRLSEAMWTMPDGVARRRKARSATAST